MSGAGVERGASVLRLRVDPDAGPGPMAWGLSALVHLALLLALPMASADPPPALVALPVRLVAALPEPLPERSPRERSEAPPEELPAPPVVPPSPPERPPTGISPEPPRSPVVEPELEEPTPEPEEAPAVPEPDPEPEVPPPPREEKPAAKVTERPVVRQRGVAARFEGARLPHAAYLDSLVRDVSRAWLKPRSARPGRPAVLLFVIARDGRVSGLVVEQGSGVALYDRSALRAVQLASPLPPLPPSYLNPVLKVHFEFIP